jgi:hypothetical protein
MCAFGHSFASFRVPKPVFHNKKSAPHQHRQEVISPQHEELIKFVHECESPPLLVPIFLVYIVSAWNKVCAEMCQDSDGCSSPKSKIPTR